MVNWVLLCCFATVAAPDEGSSPAQRIFLDGQRGTLDLSGEQPVLRFQVLAHNRLPVAVEAVEVGVVFAKTDEELALADPVAAYSRAEPRSGERLPVAGVRQWLTCQLAPDGEAALTVEQPLRTWYPEPNAFVTHVLGYRLADWSLALLEELLASEVPADEVAVVETLALTASAERKLAVRARWGDRQVAVTELIALVQAPAPAAPRFPDCLRRVLAIRALGVLGGEAAQRTLEALHSSSALDAFDDALLVVSVARAQGSPLEAAMAHAVPAEAEHLRDVVAAALTDVALTPAAVAAASVEPPSAPVVLTPAATTPETDGTARGRWWPWLVLAGLAILAGFMVARRADRPGT